ncbi:response regulator [Robiginitalea sp. IMCC44478]|uniref:response regulator n=1 Tax=Robiginitalea sp. IMCC44478 TaxID=3459122 RepID=UPI0040432E9B
MKKILIIEDNPDVRENTADLLRLSDFEVYTSADGDSGVRMARKIIPDLIVCDIMMPGTDGYQVLAQLSAEDETGSIPFIFLTAKSEKADIRKGMNLGADDYLTKPFEEEELLMAIEARLKKHDFLQKEFSKDLNGIHRFLAQASAYLNREHIEKSYREKHFDKRDLIFMEGDAAHYLYFLDKGLVKTHKTTEGGKEFVTGMFQSGDFLGQLSLLNPKGTYLHTATVMESTVVYPIPKADFMELITENREVSRKFMELISKNLIEVQEQLVNMAYCPVRQRMAHILLKLQELGLINNHEQQGIDIAREDLAGMVGTATETAIRTLSEFKEEGIIKMGKSRRIIIKNPERLAHAATFGQ